MKGARILSATAILLVGFVGVAAAQQPAKPPAAAPAPAAPAKTAATPPGKAGTPTGASAIEQYLIGPEDILAVTVWKNEAMSRVVAVRPDGMISLPLLDDVQASGLTAMQLRDVLAKKLSEYMPSPEVSVIVNDVRSFKVSVMGEVARPARYELKSWTTVLDVLAQAGGFNQFANRSKIVILRPNGKVMTRIPFNYNRVVASGGEEENFYLQPGDIVLVP
ncbi:MAG TPA: polysaccharide biosynthesis/export family protein [Methylomirabilota bacterium]|jgi:polysaccharide export outer membrane protein